MKVYEREHVIVYLKKRQLLAQYPKVKANLETGRLKQVDFKPRKPKTSRIYQFRITKKYRAFGHFIESDFVVASISDHQN